MMINLSFKFFECIFGKSGKFLRVIFCAVVIIAPVFGAPIRITGHIVDGAGKKLAGATVRLLVHNLSSVTDTAGFFAIIDNTADKNRAVSPRGIQIRGSSILFSITSSDPAAVRIDAYSLAGRKVPLYSATLVPGSYSYKLRKNDFAQGIYLIKMAIGTAWYTRIAYNFKDGGFSGKTSGTAPQSDTAIGTAESWDTLMVSKEKFHPVYLPLATPDERIPQLTIKQNVAPATPSRVSPYNNFQFYYDTITLTWHTLDKDSGRLHSNLYFGRTNPPPLFASNIPCTDTQTSYTVNPADGWVDDVPYYWYAEVSDGVDSTKDTTTSVIHFTTTLPQKYTWTLQTPYNPVYGSNDVFFIDSLTGWSAYGAGGIWRTDDGGLNWKIQTPVVRYNSFLWGGITSLNIVSLYFTNRDTGFACGMRDTLLYTVDGGTTWLKKHLDAGSGNNFRWIRFPNPAHGWIAGDSVILHTTDGGATWARLTTPIADSGFTWQRVEFTDTLNGWIRCTSKTPYGMVTGRFYQTNDGGTTWTRQLDGKEQNITSAFYLDKNTGWAAGSQGTIWKTTNGGAAWALLNRPQSDDIHELYFTDSLHGFALHEYYTSSTTDGGTTWTELNMQLYGVGGTINFLKDSRFGWICSPEGWVAATKDSGLTWVPFSSDYYNKKLVNLSVVSSLNVWAVDENSLPTVFTAGSSEKVPIKIPRQFSQRLMADEPGFLNSRHVINCMIVTSSTQKRGGRSAIAAVF
jgi:photosystem II stability/assembly factor-like uncharacterized protein